MDFLGGRGAQKIEKNVPWSSRGIKKEMKTNYFYFYFFLLLFFFEGGWGTKNEGEKKIEKKSPDFFVELWKNKCRICFQDFDFFVGGGSGGRGAKTLYFI